MHSLRRTAATIVKVFFKEVLNRNPTAEETQRVKTLFGWKSDTSVKTGETSLFTHYAKGWETRRLAELPDIYSGLIAYVLGVKPTDDG